MKSLLTMLVIGGLSLAGSAQDLSEIHDYLKNKDGCISMSLNVDLDDVFDGEFDEIDIEGEVDKTEFSLIANSEDDLDEIYHSVYDRLIQSGLQKIEIQDEDDTQVLVFAEKIGEPVDRFYAFVTHDDETLAFITVEGDFIVTED